MVAAGLAEQGEVFEDDVEMLSIVATALNVGMPADALLQLVRVYNDALTRVAEAENRLFHFYVHERLKADGLEGSELAAATDAVSAPLRGLIEPIVLYFHRKAFKRALRDDFVVHLADDVARAGDGRVAVGEVPVTVLFIDLASFTVMTEVMGDSTAAAVVERFSDIVREVVGDCEGRVLKQIGDELMLIFQDEPSAVMAGLGVMARVAAEPQFPDVRLGAHGGTALYREGDYFGATVNVAARVAAQATRGQFLVTAAIANARLADHGIEFQAIGRRALKNVATPVELYEVTSDQMVERPIDPVCGMAIDPQTCTVRLDADGKGEAVLCCSDSCRDRFLDAPERYGTTHSAGRAADDERLRCSGRCHDRDDGRRVRRHDRRRCRVLAPEKSAG